MYFTNVLKPWLSVLLTVHIVERESTEVRNNVLCDACSVRRSVTNMLETEKLLRSMALFLTKETTYRTMTTHMNASWIKNSCKVEFSDLILGPKIEK